jgi:hypothetical protein
MTMSEIMEVADHAEGTSMKLTAGQYCARRTRSIAIALALGAFVLMIFAVTIVRLGSGAFTSPDYMRPVKTIGSI